MIKSGHHLLVASHNEVSLAKVRLFEGKVKVASLSGILSVQLYAGFLRSPTPAVQIARSFLENHALRVGFVGDPFGTLATDTLAGGKGFSV